MADDRSTPEEQVRKLYDDAERSTAKAMERLVRTDGFGDLLASMTENVMGVTRIANGVLDLAVRNLRVASRQDMNRLGRQLARTEDKLEMVLQEIERLRDELASAQAGAPAKGRSSTSNGPTGGSRRKSARGS
ncbi:MAG: hypothetical protein M3296_05570 [Actinomycetota bacterium]|nr:hypothetical protein [Actinomycetota bacterium]